MAILTIHDLTFAYPAGPVALEHVSLVIADEEAVGLVGPNGAGKTTLFLCLSGVLTVPPKAIRVAGLDPAIAKDRSRLPSHVGIVFQNSEDQLFNSTVYDDVAFGPLNLGLPADEIRRRVALALERTGLTGKESRVPFHLSGGEQRRAALAGVLAMRPHVILLDEPSQHLDPRGRRELIGLLQELPGAKIIASHDLEFILATCPRTLLLDHGRLLADGPTRTLLGDKELMEAHGLEVPHSLTYHASTDRHH